MSPSHETTTHAEDYGVTEVARRFAISRTQVMRLARRGWLPGTKVQGRWRFTQQALDQVVATRLVHRGED